MAKDRKHFVFSARTTEEGLKALNGLKARLGVSWDALVVEAVCAHYGLDRAVMVDEAAEKRRADGEAARLRRQAEKAEREKAARQRKREKERKAKAAAKKREKVAEESADSTATQAETGEG